MCSYLVSQRPPMATPPPWRTCLSSPCRPTPSDTLRMSSKELYWSPNYTRSGVHIPSMYGQQQNNKSLWCNFRYGHNPHPNHTLLSCVHVYVREYSLISLSLSLYFIFDSELVEKYRSYSKEIQRLKKKLEVLEEERKQQTQALGLTGWVSHELLIISMEVSTTSLHIICRTPRKLQGAGSKASEKVLSLSAEVAAQKRHSRMEKVCCEMISFSVAICMKQNEDSLQIT